jgi:hypothetical protein
MLISAYAGNPAGNNGGYRGDVLENIQTDIDKFYNNLTSASGYNVKLPSSDLKIPNPLSYYSDVNRNIVYYKIPVEYLYSNDPSSQDGNFGACTPGILQLSSNGASGLVPANTGATGARYMPRCAPANTPIDPVALDLDPSGTKGSPLVIANFNYDGPTGWSTYMSQDDTNQTRAKFARFMLCSLLNDKMISNGNPPFDLHIYGYPDELVQYNDGNNVMIDYGGNVKNKGVYSFTSDDGLKSVANGTKSSGTLTGSSGYWNTREYSFNKFMKKIGVWILMSIVILVLIYMAYTYFRYGRKENDEKK